MLLLPRYAQVRSVGRPRSAKREESWTPIASVQALKGFFSRDIWSAWDEESDESLLDAGKHLFLAPLEVTRSSTSGGVARSLGRACRREESKPRDDTDAFDTPRKVLPPVAELPRAEDTPKAASSPPAQVIDFPVPPELQSVGAHALDLKREPANAKRSPGRVPVRWAPIIVIGALASAAMMMWVWFVNINADAEFAARPQVSAAAPSLGAPLPEEAVAAISPYDALEDDLRAQLMGILDIR